MQSATPTAHSLNRRTSLRRAGWHALGLVIAAIVAWLIVQGYRQPELLLDLANMRLC